MLRDAAPLRAEDARERAQGAAPHHEGESYALAFACAMNARQPPKAEMSRAPCVAAASARKPLSLRPSASVSVPIERGGGTLATKRPNASAGIAQISTAMAAPPASTRMSPGFAGAPGNRNRR